MVSRNWKRVATLGSGTTATVSLATFDDDDSEDSIHCNLMAVKSSRSFDYASKLVLEREKKILEDLVGCSQIVQCFGDDLTVESGEEVYNIFLDYVPSGSLFDYMNSSNTAAAGCYALPDRQVRRLTQSLLKGLMHIHSKGYVHCDIKPDNVLIWSSEEVKIADFGLAKRCGEKSKGMLIRGTPTYVAPEGVNRNEYEKPSDIWSLGCIVFEMLTGEPARKLPDELEFPTMFYLIGRGNLLTEIPETVSEEGKDFLEKCLQNEPERRWTAEMLLEHPFVTADGLATEESASTQCASFQEGSDDSTNGREQFSVVGFVA